MSVLCRNHSTFSNQSPIVGRLGYQQGLTLCSEGAGEATRAGGGRRGDVKGRGLGFVPQLNAIFSVAPSPDSKLCEESPCEEGPHPRFRPASRSLEGPLVPVAAGGTICTAQVCPAPCPTWGLRTLGRLWAPASPAGSCARAAICVRRAAGRGRGRRAEGPSGRALAGPHSSVAKA